MNKHAPGPWYAQAYKGDMRDATGKPVCIVHVNGHTTPEIGAANARLIAAAPELLEALREVVRIWDENNGPDPFPELEAAGAPRNRMIDDIRALFARIDGEG